MTGLMILLQCHHGDFHLPPKKFFCGLFFFSFSLLVCLFGNFSATKQALGLHINVNLTFMKMFPGTEAMLGGVVQV